MENTQKLLPYKGSGLMKQSRLSEQVQTKDNLNLNSVLSEHCCIIFVYGMR